MGSVRNLPSILRIVAEAKPRISAPRICVARVDFRGPCTLVFGRWPCGLHRRMRRRRSNATSGGTGTGSASAGSATTATTATTATAADSGADTTGGFVPDDEAYLRHRLPQGRVRPLRSRSGWRHVSRRLPDAQLAVRAAGRLHPRRLRRGCGLLRALSGPHMHDASRPARTTTTARRTCHARCAAA